MPLCNPTNRIYRPWQQPSCTPVIHPKPSLYTLSQPHQMHPLRPYHCNTLHNYPTPYSSGHPIPVRTIQQSLSPSGTSADGQFDSLPRHKSPSYSSTAASSPYQPYSSTAASSPYHPYSSTAASSAYHPYSSTAASSPYQPYSSIAASSPYQEEIYISSEATQFTSLSGDGIQTDWSLY